MEHADVEEVLLRKKIIANCSFLVQIQLLAGACGPMIAEDIFFCDLRGDGRLLNYDVYRLLSAALTVMIQQTRGGPFTFECKVEDQQVRLRLCDRPPVTEREILADTSSTGWLSCFTECLVRPAVV
jgi:hypothetical protein